MTGAAQFTPVGSVNMPYWTVLKGGKTVYRGAELVPRDDGSLVLPSGELISEPYHVTGPHDGDPPAISGKGSTPPPTGKPDRINKAGGYGPDNIR